MRKICEICGNPSGMYPLCPACFKLRDEGKIEKCSVCGKWHKINEPCNCKEQKKEEPIVKNEEPHHGCILCGKDANEFLFCKSCYQKYKNKSLLLKINKCTEIEILDESYEGLYTCKDGHVVKSKSEREIDNYFFDHKIAHAYEKALEIDGEDFHPDFYLPEKKIYLEHWGYDESNSEYTKIKKYKLEKYKKEGITLICTYEKYDAKDIEFALDKKLKNYKEGEINFLVE